MYKWDERIGRYRDSETGKLVSRGQVFGWVQSSLGASENMAETLANYVANGFVSVNDFYKLMQNEIKSEYIRQFLTGIGGQGMMTKSYWGMIGAMIKEQYKYLKGFIKDILTGKLTEAQIANRAKMYLNSAREAFEKAKWRTAQKYGYDEVFWLITPGIENCADCILYFQMGWVRIDDNPYKGAFPGSGHTICLTACKCQLLYRNSVTGVEYWGL